MKTDDDKPIRYGLTQAGMCVTAKNPSRCGKQSIDSRRRCGLPANHNGSCRFDLGIPPQPNAKTGWGTKPKAREAPAVNPAADAALGSGSPSVLPDPAPGPYWDDSVAKGYRAVAATVGSGSASLLPKETDEARIAAPIYERLDRDRVAAAGYTYREIPFRNQPDFEAGIEAPIQGVPAIETSTRCVGSTKYEAPAIRDVTCRHCKELLQSLGAAIEEFNAFTRPKLKDYAKLSYQDVLALKQSIVIMGSRVRKAHEAFKAHADICRLSRP